MKGSKRENMKNAAISLLLGFIAATSLEWRDVICQIGGGYIVMQVVWVALTTYDEILRKRRGSMYSKRKARP